jgi:uncharacterized protein YcbX
MPPAEEDAMNTCAVVGTVRDLWRFPVKSMRGERLAQATLGTRGLVGDRAWALVDQATGRPASAKKQNDFPGLMDFQARFIAEPRSADDVPPVAITLPDGTRVSSDAGEADRALSAWFRRELRLVPMATAGAFLDAFPVSVLTTSTLFRFEELAPGSRFDPRRFRMNLVLDTGAPGFIENGWIGRRLGIGDAAWLDVEEHDSRCVMTTLAQDDLPDDPDIMRTMTEHNRIPARGGRAQPCAGVYATVATAGSVRVGDRVTID